MTDDRKGGLAFIAGSLLLLVVMAHHPTGHDLFAPGRFESAAFLSGAVHALAIATLPLFFLGALALSRLLDSPDRLAVAALVVYGIALVAGMIAGAVSGFVGPALGREMLGAGPSERDAWRVAFHYSGVVNQAFAKVLAVASSVAIVLWSVAIVRTRRFPLAIGLYGLVAGLAIAVAVLFGYLRLGVRGFGFTVLAQSIWFITVGVGLSRRTPVETANAA